MSANRSLTIERTVTASMAAVHSALQSIDTSLKSIDQTLSGDVSNTVMNPGGANDAAAQAQRKTDMQHFFRSAAYQQYLQRTLLPELTVQGRNMLEDSAPADFPDRQADHRRRR